MNATATASANLVMARPGGRGRKGLSVGWSVSRLVHAAIVAWLLQARAPRQPDGPPGKRIEVRPAPRQAARLIARESGKSLVALPARKPVVDPNGEREVVDPLERARRADCKTAYAGAGLLAVIPLAVDAVTGTGCKW